MPVKGHFNLLTWKLKEIKDYDGEKSVIVIALCSGVFHLTSTVILSNKEQSAGKC
jgi:hypothetical protein